MQTIRHIRRAIRRDLFLGASICALVFACALMWGRPFVSNGPVSGGSSGSAHPARPAQNSDVAVFGTIAEQRGQCVLEDETGHVYALDDRVHALTDGADYNGKNVEVTGQLDEREGTIHVARIKIVAA